MCNYCLTYRKMYYDFLAGTVTLAELNKYCKDALKNQITLHFEEGASREDMGLSKY